jgi:NCAIR mutase (PurE)-related protein
METMNDQNASPVTLDFDRTRRCGFPEVVYGEGKSVQTLVDIFRQLLADGVSILATRVAAEKARQLLPVFPSGCYNELARTFRLSTPAADAKRGRHRCRVAVVSAGTSDLPIAEEARETLDWMGIDVAMIHDVGVAGPHRLPAHMDKLRGVEAVVVVAGMEGALPSVVGGYVDCPVIAVPTSVGYGANFGGISALLGMLNSCASNVTVVNIDAGFKGGYVAGLIASRADRAAGGKGRGKNDQIEAMKTEH